MVTPTVGPQWPERCPCGGWPNDPGVQIPESPDLYNHRVVTHWIAQSHGSWAVFADLSRVQTNAEKQRAAAVRADREARLTAASGTWQTAMESATPPALSCLLAMHEPYLMHGEILCEHCIDEYDDHVAWPCRHWDLLTQLAA